MAIATLSIDLVAKLANLERDMGRAAHIAEKNAARMESAFAGVKTSLAAIGSVLTVGAFAGMVRGVADAGDQLAKLSTRTGIAVEELSKLQYAASLSDVSNEDLSTSLGRLNKVLGEAADGSKQATEALARFGIAPGTLNASQAFEVIADRVKNTGDQTKIASAMNDIFGRSWQTLMPLIKGGSEGLRDAGDELERIGGVMSGELAEASEKFNDNLTKIERSLDSLKIQTLGPVVSGLETLTSRFNEAAKAAGGFWAGLMAWGSTTVSQESSPGQAIAELTKKLDVLKEQKEGLEKTNYFGFLNKEDLAINSKQIETITKQIAYLEELRKGATKNSEYFGQYGTSNTSGPEILGTPAATTKTGRTGSSKVERFDLSQFDALIKAEESYLQALEGIAAAQENARRSTLGLSEAQSKLLDLQQSDVWATLSDEQKQAAEEQARYADETIRAAESQERLNSLIAGLDSSQIEQAWQDMDLLNKALEAGSVSQAQYSEAVKKLFDGGNEKIKESTDVMATFAEQAARNMQDAFADFLFDPFEGGVDEMLANFGTMLQKMVAQAVAADLAKRMFGEVGGGEGSGWLGMLAKALEFNADGGVYASPGLSAYSGQIVSKPTVFPFAKGIGLMGEAGAEAILPLKRGADGKLGVSAGGGGGHTINVYVSGNSAPDVRRSAAQGAREALSALNTAQRYS